jgi:hypothetical protein
MSWSHFILGTKRISVVEITQGPPSPEEEPLVPDAWENGWAPEPLWTLNESSYID